jgi:hypothetical protein
MKKDEKNNNNIEQPLSYPRPSRSDKQFNDEPEYIDQEPNKFDKQISDIPAEKTGDEDVDSRS